MTIRRPDRTRVAASRGRAAVAKPPRPPTTRDGSSSDRAGSRGLLDAAIIIANAPDPVFVSDLEGKILQANDAVSKLLGFRPDELLEQSLSRFISPKEKREFTAARELTLENGLHQGAET